MEIVKTPAFVCIALLSARAAVAEPISTVAAVLWILGTTLNFIGDAVEATSKGADPVGTAVRGNADRLDRLHERMAVQGDVLAEISHQIADLPLEIRREFASFYSFERRNSIAAIGALADADLAEFRAGRVPAVGLDFRLHQLQLAREELFRDTATRNQAPTLDETNALVLAAIYELRILQFLAADHEADSLAATETAYARQYVERLNEWSDRLLRVFDANTRQIRAGIVNLDSLRDVLSTLLADVRGHFPYILRDGSIDLSVLDEEEGETFGQCSEGFRSWKWVEGPDDAMRVMVQMGQVFGYRRASSRILADEQNTLTHYMLAVARQAEVAMSLTTISEFMALLTGEPTLAIREVQDMSEQLAELQSSLHRNSRRMQSWRSIIDIGLKHGPFVFRSEVVRQAYQTRGGRWLTQCP